MSDPLELLRSSLSAVEPSASFARETQTRIEHARAPHWRGRLVTWLVPLAAAAGVVVAVSLRPSPASTASTRNGAAAPASTTTRMTQSALEPVGPVGSVTSAPAVTPRVSRPSVAPVPVPVAWRVPADAHADQAIAMRRLLSMVTAGNLPPMARPDTVSTPSSSDLTPIQIRPITITPLPPLANQGGGTER